MLHRSFKPAKCKTALKLTVSRIKLMKNKRAAHIVSLRRDVAQLLESGQERTARIQVEHVVREEKTMVAYDLLEVYLELIVARLPMIESQKNCPTDLKEAVTSVIFASLRCTDLPELQDIRKHLQSKYGKEFSTAAMELRPGCGVSCLMIEKLSVAAPDAQTKTKILSAIALEHKIDWDPKASGENEEKPPEDMLNGPNSFLKASQKYQEPLVQAPTVNTKKHDAYIHESPSSPTISQKLGSSTTPSTSQSQPVTQSVSRVKTEETGHMHTYSGDQKTYAAGKQHWNMEFTDATSAAQAAAEAAERASMAARAAAELSSDERILRQQSSESQRPSVNDLRNASMNRHTGPASNAIFSKDPAKEFQHGGDSKMESNKSFTRNSLQPYTWPDAAYRNQGLESFSEKSNMPPYNVVGNDVNETNSKLESSKGSGHFSRDSMRNSHEDLRVKGTSAYEQGNPIRENEQLNHPVHIRGSSRSDSLKSEASFQEEEVFLNIYREDIFSNNNQAAEQENDFAGEAGWERGSSNHKSIEADDVNYFADEIMDEKSNKRNASTKFEGDHNDILQDTFDDLEYSKFHGQSTEHETVIFDNSGSDDDLYHKVGFTSGFKEDDFDPFKSPDQRSPISESPKRSSWFTNETSYDRLASKQVFADEESSSTKPFGDQSDIVGSFHSHESLPVAFDESESEAAINGSDHGVSSTHETLIRHSGVSAESGNCECVATFPVFDDDESQDSISSRSVDNDLESKPIKEPPYTSEAESSIEKPVLDTGKELNLGLLNGGFRNKGIKNPLYIKSPSEAPSLPADTSLSQTSTFENSAKQRLSGLHRDARMDKKSSPTLRVTRYDLEDDSSHSEDEPPQISIMRSQETQNQNASSVSSHKSSFNYQSTYSDIDKLLNEEAATMQNSRTTPDIGSSSVNAYKSNVSSRATYLDDDNLQNDDGVPVQVSRPKPHLGSGLSRRTKSSTPDGQRKPSRETQTTDQDEISEVPRLTRPIPRKSTPEAKRRPLKPSSSNEPFEYSSNGSPAHSKDTASSSNPKAEQSTTRQDSIKKASHVHPKLPDFDTLAAHFSSLRTDSK